VSGVVALDGQDTDAGVLRSVKSLSLLLMRNLFLGPEPLYKTAIPSTTKGKKIVAEFRPVRVKQRVLEWMRLFLCSCQLDAPPLAEKLDRALIGNLRC
jgi:hypothetical protein